MSNIYITEPGTEGKVLLHTSFGDLDVELWPQQAPKACRNFVQLSLEGYYDDTIFHRIIAGFMVQGGDPTGTGSGGESVFGQAFADEFHSRLRFNHRGLLAMANENKPNSNHSQFFFTLDACEFLDKKHTIFGKITGNTIFNLLSVGDVETDANDRPLNPPKLLSVEVLWNPFDDVVPRNIKHKKGSADSEAEDALKKRKRERKATKDLNLLSFGDDEVAFESSKPQKGKRKKMMSSHDLLEDKKLKAEVDEKLLEKIAKAGPIDKDNVDEKKKEKKLSAKESLKAAVAAASSKSREIKTEDEPTGENRSNTDAAEIEKKSKKKKERTEVDEYQQLRSELKKSRQAVPLLMGDKAKEQEKARAFHDMLTPLQQQRQKYMQKKKAANRSSRQQDTLAKLKSFEAALMAANTKSKAGVSDEASEQSKDQDGYHGQVLESDDEADSKDDKSWMAAKLKFKKHIDDQFRAGAGPSVDDYMTIDSRTQPDSTKGGHGDRERTRDRDRSRDRGTTRDRETRGGRDRERRTRWQ